MIQSGGEWNFNLLSYYRRSMLKSRLKFELQPKQKTELLRVTHCSSVAQIRVGQWIKRSGSTIN